MGDGPNMSSTTRRSNNKRRRDGCRLSPIRRISDIKLLLFKVELDKGTKSMRDKPPQCTALTKAKPAPNNIPAMFQPPGAQPGDGEGDVAEELFHHLGENTFGHVQPAPMPARQESADTGGAESSRQQVGKGEKAIKRARS